MKQQSGYGICGPGGGRENWDEPGRLVEMSEGSGRLIVRLIITDKRIGQNTKTNKMCDPPRTLLQSRSPPHVAAEKLREQNKTCIEKRHSL